MGLFDEASGKNTVIIVADKNHQKYGSFLQQLLSQKDDSNGDVVGVKDNTVKAVVWTDKNYKDSKAKISSVNKCIFIGDSKIIRDETANIPRTFKEYGMQYGWLGSRAVLDLDLLYPGFIDLKTRNNFGKYVVEKHQSLGLTGNGKDSWIVNALLVSNPVAVKDVQYNCLVEVFYLQAAQKFIEG